MKPTIVFRATLLATLLGFIGCALRPGEEPLGVAQVAITNVPDGVACIRITAAGDVTVETRFDVTPGESSVFSLDRLPVGAVEFTGDAFPSICAVVSAATVATWVSDPVIASVDTQSPVTVSLVMHRNGKANVGVDFDDAGCRANGVPCASGAECCAGQCAGGACCTPLGDPCAANSDCCVGVCNQGACQSLSGCQPNGAMCGVDVECCNGSCHAGLCQQPPMCQPNGAMCGVDAECCNGSCYAGLCQQPPVCQPNGAACGGSADCCGGAPCVDGVCCNSTCGGGAQGDCQACSIAAGAAIDGACGPTTGNACDDGDACTQIDTCQSGVCSGSNPIVCSAQDQCHSAGACDPLAGVCSTPSLPDNTVCDDGNASTVTDVCHGGVCAGNTCVNLVRGSGFVVADTYLHSGNPGTNYGSAAELVLGSSTQSLLRFDLSSIPAGAHLVSVSLRVRTQQVNLAATVNVHNVLAPWVEGTVTYASFGGAFAPAILASYQAASGFHSLDVLPLAQAWFTGATANYGVLLESSTFSSIYGSETIGTASQPTLRVCYWM